MGGLILSFNRKKRKMATGTRGGKGAEKSKKNRPESEFVKA